MTDYRTRTQKRKAGDWHRARVIVEVVSRKDGGGTRVRANPHVGAGPARSYVASRQRLIANAAKKLADRKAAAAAVRTPTRRGT